MRLGNIYFVSESIPHEGYGSFVVFFRHLKRLQSAGYSIHLIIPDYNYINSDDYVEAVKNDWHIIKLPTRKRWYPPYRFNNSILRSLRFEILYQTIKFHLIANPPKFILGYLHGTYLSGFATFLKNKLNCKLGVFLHDDRYLLTRNANKRELRHDQRVCKNSQIIWTVTEDLKIENTDHRKYKLLYPIPSNITNIKKNWEENFVKPIIGFAGTLYDAYLPILGMIAMALKLHNGQLKVVSKEFNQDWLMTWALSYDNVEIIPSFESNGDALAYLRKICTALYCGYPTEEQIMPWTKTSFPSKLVEYSHLGLPIVLSGRSDSYLTKWAKQRKWPLFFNNYYELVRIIDKLIDQKDWVSAKDYVNELAYTEFNPDIIHSEFLNSIVDTDVNNN